MARVVSIIILERDGEFIGSCSGATTSPNEAAVKLKAQPGDVMVEVLRTNPEAKPKIIAWQAESTAVKLTRIEA